MVKVSDMYLSAKGSDQPTLIALLRCTNVVCRHPSEKVTRARHDESTSNLNRHADNCNPKGNSSTRALAAFAHGSLYNPGLFRLKLAIWISRRHRPFVIVDDPEFQELLTILNCKVSVPSSVTVSRDVQEIFSISQKVVGTLLKVCFHDGLQCFLRRSTGVPWEGTSLY
jgi:hypothetical protein